MIDETKGDRARAEILEAAKRLFFSKGYNATSMRDIAREAGDRAVSGIYNHFPNKQAIFQALVDYRSPYDELFPILEAGLGDTAPEYLSAVLKRVLPAMAQYSDFIELILIDAREFEGANILRLIQTQLVPRAFVVIQHIAALPGLRINDPVVLMRLFISFVIGYSLTNRFAPEFLREFYADEAWIDRYVDAFLRGIAADDAEASQQED